MSEVCDRLKFNKPTPVVILAGAKTHRAGKTLAGVCRAAFRTGACIVDSGLASGIEKFCMRKNVPLIGVCPETEISYPKLNPAHRKENELSNGHTHFFLIGKEDKSNNYKWGEESLLKYDLSKRIASGKGKGFNGDAAPACKSVTVVLGDNVDQSLRDIIFALNQK